MATDMTLKLTDIPGESVKEAHKDEIDVLSYSWGATQSGTAHVATGSTAGQANVQDLTISKFVDKSTPILFKYCMTGEHIKEAVLSVRKAGGKKPVDYLVITLSKVLVSSVSSGAGGGDDRVQETVSLNFAEIKVEYKPQKEDGTASAAIPATYNVATQVVS